MIMASVTLREGGAWFIISLASPSELIPIFNNGFYNGEQLFAIKVDLFNESAVYDFVTKQWRKQ